MAKYEGPERRATYGWHLNREFTISHIVTTIVMAVSLLKWGMAMDARVSAVETREQAQELRDASQDRMLERFDGALSSRLDRIEAKLDRVIENGRALKQDLSAR